MSERGTYRGVIKRVLTILVILVVAVGLATGGWWYTRNNPEWQSDLQVLLDDAVADLGLEPEEEPAGLVASGFIEADDAAVTTEVGGRIVALHADEGEEVVAGQTLAELDDSLLRAQVKLLEAEVAVAEAQLALVNEGVRGETLDYAQALVDQADVAREAAWVAVEDAQAMLDDPQELQIALIEARNQVELLHLQEEQALALAKSAQVARDFADETVRALEDFEPFNVDVGGHEFRVKLPGDARSTARQEQAAATYRSWEAWTGLTQAQTARTGAESYVAQLERQIANPLTLQAQVTAAESQYQIASSAVMLARTQLEGLKIGATPEQVAAVEAQVQVVKAALESIQVEIDKLTLSAPISGLVLERPVHVGELALPGAPLLTLANLDEVTMTVYVPEDQLGKVQLGQPVSVTVDAYPDRTFTGNVVFVSSQAEFTPKNVQTREERVNMVFAVRVKLPNSDHALKPGMPADSVLIEAQKQE